MRLSKFIFLPLVCLFLGCAFAYKATGQYYFYNSSMYESDFVLEGGISLGGVNGMTDVGGSKRGKANSGFMGDFTFNKTSFTGGIYGTFTYRKWIAARLDVNLGKIQAADSTLKGTKSSYAHGRLDRNLSFRSNIFQASLGLELHPFVLLYKDREPPRLSPYVFGGIGWMKFNPRAELNGVWYDLEPLRLEGQGFDEYPDRQRYKTNTIEVPYGLGLRYEASDIINIRFELAKHTLFTDYLDDVSQENWIDPALFYKYLSPAQADVAVQLYNRSTVINPPRNTRPRGKSNNNDAYWNAVIKVGLNISALLNTNGMRDRGRTSCPTIKF